MNKTTKDLIFLAVFTLILTFLIWLPHILAIPNFWGLNFSNGFSTIYRNFDGLEYVVIAKSWYDPSLIAKIPQQLSANYYASHFPGYAILIALFSPLLGFLKSMLFVSVLSTILATWAFYFFVLRLKLTQHPLFLSLLFLVLPARWLIVHSVGSSEPLFIFLIITAMYFFIRFEQTGHFMDVIFAGIFGLFAQLVRPPGILLVVALGLYILWQGYKKRSLPYIFSFYPLILIPLTLLGIFYGYSITYQDFFAYFHSGDNIHLTFPPLSVFNKGQFWVGDIWLEDIVYIFILGFLGGIILWRKKLYPMAFLVLTYMFASVFVAHRDISRYLLPISPFIIIAYEKVLTSKEFKIILPIIALAIYLYSQNYIIQNVAPIPDLTYFN